MAQGTPFFSTAVRAGGFMVSEAEGFRSRERIIVAHGENLKAGHVLGLVRQGAATAHAQAAGNTGNGTITASPALETGALDGIYRLRAIGGGFAATRAAGAGNTGGGALTLADPATGDGVRAGVYRVTCITAVGGGGEFAVFDPDGALIGEVAVGVPFDGVVKFTIADGTPDFVVGDNFEITVTAVVPADGGTFSVAAPTGEPLPNAVVGTPYTTQIGFTIADGTTDFVVGDGFDVVVTLGINKYREYNPDNTDGSEFPAGILWDFANATDADVVAAAVVRNAEVNQGELTWFTGATSDQIAEAIRLMRDELDIVARPSIPA